jgi:hypothetical protein
MMRRVFIAVAIGFPVVLLLAVLGLERVERRLGDGKPRDEGGRR